MQNNKKKNVNKYKKPNWFIYHFFRFLCVLISKFIINTKIEKNELKKVKGPYVIIANHESVIDFINIAIINRNRIHFVMSSSFYHGMKLNPYLKLIRVIPKQQFQTLPSDLKAMKNVISNNGSISLFPAGLMPESGISTPIVKGTAKALKWFGVDVYLAKTEGSYFTKPKWSKKTRKGKIRYNITKLFDTEQLKDLSNDEIAEIMDKNLYFDSYKNQERNMIAYKNGNDVEGLENVLYVCPKCKQEFTIYHNEGKLICRNCNNTAYADKYGFLLKEKETDIIYKNVSDWVRFIEEYLYEKVKEEPSYNMVGHGKISMINYKKHQFEVVGDACVTLDSTKFTLKGLLNNEPFEKEFSIREFQVLPFTPGKFFEIQDGKDIYRILLDNNIEISKWIHLLKVYYRINHENKE